MSGKRRSFEGNEAAKFANLGPKQSAVQTNPLTLASNILAITGETVAFSAGAAGITGIVSLDKAPVFDAYGSRIGSKGATSFAWVTGTVLTREVEYDDDLTDTEMLAALSENGDYAIDYVMGRIYYKKATTGTSDTCGYTTRQLNIEITGAADIEIGAVELKNAATDDRALISDANTARAATDHVLSVQQLAADGTVPPSGSLVTNAPFVKVTDGVDTLDVIVQDAAFGTASKGLPLFGKYEATPTTYTDGDAAPILLDANGRIVLSSDIEIGAVELKNGATDDRALISDANTARAATDHVLAVQDIDAAGLVWNAGTAVMAASRPVTLATDDTQFGAVGAAADVDGNIHGQLRYIGEAVDNLPAQGTAAMAGSVPVTIATDDTQMGAVGAAADVDGNVHGQLRYIGEAVDGLEAPIFAEDTASQAADKGVGFLAIRKDVGGTMVDTDGDYTFLQVDANGALRCNIASSSSQFAEDTAHVSGDVGTEMLAVRNDALATLCDTDGDYAPMQVDASGALYVGFGQSDPHLGAVGAASDVDGVIHGQLRYIGESVDNIPAQGAALAAASTPVTIATDDAHMGAVGAAADADGVLHGQLYYLANQLDALVSALDGNIVVTNASAAGAIATTTAVAAKWKLNHITVHFSAAPTTSEDLTITLDANDGAAYDTVLFKQDPSASSATDLVYKPVGDLILEAGDEVAVAFTNTDGRTYGLRIVGQLI